MTTMRWLLLLLLLLPGSVSAHKLTVARVQIEQVDAVTYSVRYEVPLGAERIYGLPHLPERARWETEAPTSYGGPVRMRFTTGDRPLAAGDVITLPWEREGALVSVVWKNGTTARQYFPRGGKGIDIHLAELSAGSGSLARTAWRYLVLGFEHILIGYDHLLFVLGLLLLVQGWRKLLWTITSFTLAHSLTLGLSVFGFLRLGSEVVEPLVALSIVFVGYEIVLARRGVSTLALRWPWLVSFGFGLIHGLGFAGALEQLGLDNDSIPVALLFFNLGVEAGQLLFVGICLILGACARSIRLSLPSRAAWAPAYAIGITSAYWFLARVAAI